MEFCVFARRKITDACLFVVSFSRGDRNEPSGSRILCRAHSNSKLKVLGALFK